MSRHILLDCERMGCYSLIMRKSEYPDRPNTLGKIVRKKRMDLKMSLLELSKKIKTHKGELAESYLSRIEADKKMPSMEIAEKIANALGDDPEPYLKYVARDLLIKTFAKTSSTIDIEKTNIIIKTNISFQYKNPSPRPKNKIS